MSKFAEILETVADNPYKPGSIKHWFHENDERREAYADVLIASSRNIPAITIFRVLQTAYPNFSFKLDTVRDLLKDEANGESRSSD